MKYTLLGLTQDVLSSMDSDEINSIHDTPESQQVVTVIKTVYDDLISRGDVVSNKTLFNLVGSNDPSRPILMTKPENIDRVEWLKYDTALVSDGSPVWGDITYLDIVDFVDFTHSYNPEETDVSSFDYIADGFVFKFTYKTNTAPRYWSTFDDKTILFDSYDSSVDASLQSIKTLGYGNKTTSFIEKDDFEFILQPSQYSLLLNEAKSLAWIELKQTAHDKAEQGARRGWRHLQKTRQTTPESSSLYSNSKYFNSLPNFSRNR